MENAARDEDWKMCFTRLGPGLVLFARQWVHSRADAEDIVQEAFVRFWRRQHSIDNKALLYATVRSVAIRATTSGRHENLERAYLCRNCRRSRNLAEHGGFALSLRPGDVEKKSATSWMIFLSSKVI